MTTGHSIDMKDSVDLALKVQRLGAQTSKNATEDCTGRGGMGW